MRSRDRTGRGEDLVAKAEPADVAVRPPEPPVVARLIIEIRSDGSHTIARGAMEDVPSGQRVGVELEGKTPLELAVSIAKAIFDAPALAGRASRVVRGLLGGKGKR